MKNRKFIKIIMFSILLSLCICVPFLVHKNNLKAETNITDLTGTTWTFNSSIDISTTFSYTIEFVSDNNYFDNISCSYDFSLIAPSLVYSSSFDNTREGVYNINDNGVWANEVLRTIAVEGGTDTTNVELINYLNNNATLVGGGTPEEPEPEPTYTLNGGFKFNTNFATSNFYSTDIAIDFTNYFAFPYSSNYPSFVNFTSITFQQRDNTRAGVMYYESEYGLTLAWSDDLINGLGFWNNYNNPTLITQFIKFDNVVVSEDIYNWLNSVGTFGDFDYTDIPDDSTGDTPNTSRFQWLINDIDAFMNLEPLPNLSFYDILLVFVSIPLLIYILKLFLGG